MLGAAHARGHLSRFAHVEPCRDEVLHLPRFIDEHCVLPGDPAAPAILGPPMILVAVASRSTGDELLEDPIDPFALLGQDEALEEVCTDNLGFVEARDALRRSGRVAFRWCRSFRPTSPRPLGGGSEEFIMHAAKIASVPTRGRDVLGNNARCYRRREGRSMRAWVRASGICSLRGMTRRSLSTRRA